MKGCYIFLADGFEEVEALATRDVLVRGGVDVKLVSVNDEPMVVSSHNVAVGVDMPLCELSDAGDTSSQDFMVFPGGMPGSKNLGNCDKLVAMMNDHYARGGSVAAICAAPAYVLGKLHGMEKATFTCYDGCEGPLLELGASFVRKSAVSCGRIVTGRGAGHSIDFGLEILKLIKGSEAAQKVSSGMILACD